MNPYENNNCINNDKFGATGKYFSIVVGKLNIGCVRYDDMKSALVKANNYMADCNHRCLEYALQTINENVEVIITYGKIF